MTGKMKNDWRPVPGFSAYEVNSVGDVRRVAPASGATPGKVLKWMKTKKGYAAVSLSVDGVITRRMVHHLVLEAFVGPRPEGYVTRHLDDDPWNNTVSNLAWGTPMENAADQVAAGSHKGERHGNAVLQEKDIRTIRELVAKGVSQRELAFSYGVSQPTISKIAKRKLWGHVK